MKATLIILDERGNYEYSDSNYHAIRHAIRSYDEARRRIEAIEDNDRITNEGCDHNNRRSNKGDGRDRGRYVGDSRDRRRAHRRNGGSNEGRHQRRDNTSQVLEPVVRGELVSTVAGAVATDNEIVNLSTAVAANIGYDDDEDVLYVDLFVDV